MAHSGVVTLTDAALTERVHALWHELRVRFDVHFVADEVAFSHFSYHVVERYDLDRLDAVLAQIAAHTPSFRAKTGGLGVFTGAQPVLQIAVARNALMAALHAELWQALAPFSKGALGYYAPALWMPHITLAQRDLTHDKLSEIMRWLSAQSFDVEFEVNNLSLIYFDGARHNVTLQYAL